MGVLVSGCFFFCLPALGAGMPCLPALGACLGCLPALLAWVPASLACLLGCRPALLACLGVRPPLNVSTTRGTVPLTMATAQHDRIPSQPYGHFLVWQAPQVGGSRMAGARQAQGRVGLRVAPIGLELCGRSLRHRRSMNIRPAWAGLGLHLKGYRILDGLWPGKALAFFV